MRSDRKQRIVELAEELAPQRSFWVERNAFFYAEDVRYMRFLIPPGKRILDIGCGDGRLLNLLQPSHGVGVDFSPKAVEIARARYPHLKFHLSDIEDREASDKIHGVFDVIVLSDIIGSLDDVQETLDSLHQWCDGSTRIVIAYWSKLWAPILALAKRLNQQMPAIEQNWLSSHDIASVMELAGFEPIRLESRQLVPRRIKGLGQVVNRHIATLPGLHRLALRSYVVGRPNRNTSLGGALSRPSASIVIPCRNEAGNIEAAVQRIPRFTDDLEIIYVEGHSTDGTADEIQRVIHAYPQLKIRLAVQDGVGKADAVRKGFELARNDVLMIQDADLTAPPEDLPKFYDAIVRGTADMVIGSRMVYPMEADSMRLLNIVGNKVFSLLFTWLLGQRITDTLCGTKVVTRAGYDSIVADRGYFGDFDPFGDFDLLFGAAKQHLKIVEVPVRYYARSYGVTQISRFRHGWLLVRMVKVARRKLKAF